MNVKRFVIASLFVFVAIEAIDVIIHMLIMSKQYQAIMSVWRPNMQNVMWIMHITALIMSFLFVYIFIKGYEGKGIIEGIRYGLIIGLFMNIGAFNQYMIYPIPFVMALQWFIFGMIEFIILGIIASLIYKK